MRPVLVPIYEMDMYFFRDHDRDNSQRTCPESVQNSLLGYIPSTRLNADFNSKT